MFTKKLDSPETSELDLKALASPAAPAAPESAPPLKVPSAALTPEIQAYMNTNMANMIRDIFKELAPTLQAIALTPEKIQAMEDARRAPSESEVARRAREKREKKLQHEDIEAARQRTQDIQNACAHRYKNGQLSLAVIGNRPDRQRLLVCLQNHCIISPKMWVIEAPDSENPRGKAVLQAAHPDYVRLMREYEVTHQ